MEDDNPKRLQLDEIAKLYEVSPETRQALEGSIFRLARRRQQQDLEQFKAEVEKYLRLYGDSFEV